MSPSSNGSGATECVSSTAAAVTVPAIARRRAPAPPSASRAAVVMASAVRLSFVSIVPN